MKEQLVEIQEIWVPCAKGEGHAVNQDGTHLKLVARIANGMPLYLEKDVVLEKIYKTEEQMKHERTDTR